MIDPSQTLTDEHRAIIWRLAALGWMQSDLAHLMGVNQGRIAETLNSRTIPDLHPMPDDRMMMGVELLHVVATDRMRDMINQTKLRMRNT